MPLPSQTARPLARRNNMYRRSRKRRRPAARLASLAAAVVAVGGAWWFWPFGGEEDPADPASETTSLATNDRTLERPLTYVPTKSAESPSAGNPARESSPDHPVAREPSGRRAGADGQRESEQQDQGIEMGSAVPGGSASRPLGRDPAPAVPVEPPPGRGTTERQSGGDLNQPTDDAKRRASALLNVGLDLLARNQPIEGRREMTAALVSGSLDVQAARFARDRLATLSERLVFSPEIVPGDPFALSYAIQDRDALSRIPRKLGVQVDWRFVQRINRIERPERIRANQRIKLITGPFHAVISKHDYRMDLYLGDGADRAYVRSFNVGLGEYNSTPEGRFRVRENSKLINPEWANPRNGRRFLPDDPMNPIGEYWLGLEGDEERVAGVYGYGIHGTIEPDSIGKQASMGCIRMLPEDVALVWELLMESVSTVEIRP